MTVAITTSQNTATGNGTNTVFSYTFAAKSSAEVGVKVAGAVISANDYTVDLDETDYQGGTVTFDTAPANGAAVVLYANPLFTQESDLDNVGALLLESLESGLDRSAIRDIHLQGRINSSVRVPIGETLAELPVAATRASKAIVFDATGLDYTLINPSSFAGATGPTGATGSTGATGPTGATGATGPAATNPSYTYAINTLTPGSSATLTPSGTYPNITLTFGIPRGDAGASGALGDGTYAGIVVSGTGSALNVVAGHITLARMANLAANSFIGNNTGAAATPLALTVAQAKTLLAIGQSDVTGLVTDLAAKAPLASPALTGTPTAPTAAAATNTTQLATTAFVTTADNLKANLAAPALTGNATLDGETIGFKHIPIVAKSAAFTFGLTDDGKGINYSGAAAAATIDPVATTAYPVGYVVTGFVSGSAALTITRGAGVTLYANGSTSSANSIVAAKGRFTLIHWATNVWTVDGTNLT